MSRAEVLRATGPTASASMDVKIGITKDGCLTSGLVEFRMQGGAFYGSPVSEALHVHLHHTICLLYITLAIFLGIGQEQPHIVHQALQWLPSQLKV